MTCTNTGLITNTDVCLSTRPLNVKRDCSSSLKRKRNLCVYLSIQLSSPTDPGTPRLRKIWASELREKSSPAQRPPHSCGKKYADGSWCMKLTFAFLTPVSGSPSPGSHVAYKWPAAAPAYWFFSLREFGFPSSSSPSSACVSHKSAWRTVGNMVYGRKGSFLFCVHRSLALQTSCFSRRARVETHHTGNTPQGFITPQCLTAHVVQKDTDTEISRH